VVILQHGHIVIEKREVALVIYEESVGLPRMVQVMAQGRNQQTEDVQSPKLAGYVGGAQLVVAELVHRESMKPTVKWVLFV